MGQGLGRNSPVVLSLGKDNYEALSKLAADAGFILGVTGADINELYDTTAALEAAARRYRDDIIPFRHITLTDIVCTGRYHCTIGF